MTELSISADPVDAPARRGRAVAETFFGPQRPPTLAGWRRAFLLIALVVAGTAIALARTPLRQWNLLWAEDGAVFISDALTEGPGVVLQPYAGYLHLVPRALAEICVLFPLPIVPLVVTVVSALGASLIAAACFVFLETRLLALPLRIAAWLVCLALPIMGGEVANNLANLHWYLLIGGFFAVMSRSRSRGFLVVQCVVLAAAVGSDALALLLLPFLLFRWWAYSERRDRVLTLVFAVFAVVQIAAVLFGGGRPASAARPGLSEILDFYSFRVVLVALLGTSTPARAMEAFGAVLPGLAVAGVVAALVLVLVRDPARRVGVAVFAGSSFAFAAIVFWLQWDGFASAGLLDVFTGGRYTVAPTALLLIALLLAVDAPAERAPGPRGGFVIAVVTLVLVLVPTIIDFRSNTVRENAPAWPDALRQAAEDCEKKAPATKTVVVIAPTWFGGMPVTCAVVDDVAGP